MKKIILLVLAACYSTIMLAQSTVTGTVVSSDDGQPLPFATIQVKGTTTGEYTDDNGKYSIKVPANGVLIFSTIGFVTQEVPVAGKSVINVTLKPDAIALDETIVVAYGTAKKGTYTGSASSVKADAIKDVPAMSFESAINGRVSGLQMSPGSGQAGSTGSIRIRGIGSMNASNEPLYVIDGVPVISGDVTQLGSISSNVMSSLNPADIENITVLKDAAASSLYGSRAANGVIMITTKRGKLGKLQVNFKATAGFTPSFATKNFDPASPEQQEELLYEGAYNKQIAKGKTEAESNQYAKDWVEEWLPKDSRGYFDWEDALMRTGVYQNYDFSLSGATDKMNYYSSLSYSKEQGRSNLNDFNRISGRLNVSHKIGKIAELGVNVSITNSKKTGFDDSRYTYTNVFYAVRNLLMPQYWPTNPDGSDYKDRYPSYVYNNLYYDNLYDNYSKTFKVSAVETLSVYLIPNELTFKSIFSYDNTQIEDYEYYGPEHQISISNEWNGFVGNYSKKIAKLVTSNTLNYNKTFAEKHTLSALVGFEAETNKTNYMEGTGTKLPNNSMKTLASCGETKSSAYHYGYNLASILSRVEYNYDNRYYVSASYRRDGSSKLGLNTRWGNFWSVAGSWKINNESFLRDVHAINNLRIRGSYGVNGTLPSANYGHLPLYSFANKYQQNPGGVVSSVADSNLSWETNNTWNVALEGNFFENRLNFSAEYFNRDSKDLLQNVSISGVTGFTDVLTNYGAMNNRGFEFEVSGDIIRSKSVTWNLGITASFVKSKITKLYDGQEIIWSSNGAQFIYKEGESPRTFYMEEFAGVDPKTGSGLWFLNGGNEKNKIGEIDGRPICNNRSYAEYAIVGKADPTVYGGINTSVSWKNFTLDLNFIYSLGGTTFDATMRDNADDGYYNVRSMTQKYYNERWTPTNTNTNTPIRVLDINSAQGMQSRSLHSGDFLRLKNIALSYTFASQWMKKAKLANLRVFASASNLLTWAAYKDYDPEVDYTGVRRWEMPLGKTITFGVEFGF